MAHFKKVVRGGKGAALPPPRAAVGGRRARRQGDGGHGGSEHTRTVGLPVVRRKVGAPTAAANEEPGKAVARQHTSPWTDPALRQAARGGNGRTWVGLACSRVWEKAALLSPIQQLEIYEGSKAGPAAAGDPERAAG